MAVGQRRRRRAASLTVASTVPGWDRAGSKASGAVSEPPALVAGFYDIAVMREPVQQRSGHLGVAENAWPFAECEIGRHDHRGLLVEAADQVKQQLPTRLRERQITEFVEDEEVLAAEIIGQAPLTSGAPFGDLVAWISRWTK